jgi:hypothetical protein
MTSRGNYSLFSSSSSASTLLPEQDNSGPSVPLREYRDRLFLLGLGCLRLDLLK